VSLLRLDTTAQGPCDYVPAIFLSAVLLPSFQCIKKFGL